MQEITHLVYLDEFSASYSSSATSIFKCLSLWQLCGKCLAQGLLSGSFPVTNPCVSHAVSQSEVPTELSQSVCAERRDGVMSWAEGSR